ncbi:thioredoxin family protein [Maribacter algarum]|uniref:Thioredoxin family protein n=1 Tax=Maribacter algarum (ex Zhang et al. 2020) TaxID=2578118 RepID=A0A5S3PG73_9FLAO|nr:thioredoxin family protein [Maribacter algarum]TMM53140.1 thioredoxin family protein [Maribacter algarum]
MKIVAPILFFFFSICTFAQDWEDTYAETVATSVDQNKPIVLVFAGSDWCAPCIKLDKTIWQSEEFKTYSKENYILYKADFPRKKANQLSAEMAQQHALLAERFNPKGHFPLVVVLNQEEKVLGKMGYKKTTPEDYISLLNNCLK